MNLVNGAMGLDRLERGVYRHRNADQSRVGLGRAGETGGGDGGDGGGGGGCGEMGHGRVERRGRAKE
ncbi:uncharacterized protein HKW66_Vig0026780 [Vigna angularis]|uniref:Uncharacterized protein n=1 Tax=Phaseolus angularis TaxID=3914 RepID=A0A8T0L7E5_PHAAN|nr:uncharacterized protein HKW66_Vig0026780 [Vigna angularis]